MTLAACGRGTGESASCGIAALTGPLAIKESFGSGHALGVAPDTLPPILPVRLVAGPVMHGTVSHTAGRWAIVTKDSVSPDAQPGYGVLVLDRNARARGVLIFDGPAIMGAVRLGTVALRDTTIPLLGVQLDVAQLERASCPIFPDTTR